MGMIFLNGNEYTSSPKDGFPPIIYSDEEREIGVWRDGKPLYEKTFSGTTASDFVTIEFIVDTGSDTSIKNYFGLINGARPFNAFMDNNSRILTWVASDGHRIANWAAGGAFASLPFKMTVQYTKTTDTAGSGKYTTYGGIAHHYSTSEQVIGTWIDGKPIYEKTYSNLSITVSSASTWTSTGITISNISKIIDVIAIDIAGQKYATNGGISSGGGISIALSSIIGSTRGIGTIIIQYTKTTD